MNAIGQRTDSGSPAAGAPACAVDAAGRVRDLEALVARLERELRQARLLASLGELATGIAHEINTPVQFVSDSAYFVRDAMVDLSGLIPAYRRLQARVADGSATAADAEPLAAAAAAADLDYLLEHVPTALDRLIDGIGRVATIVHSMKEFAHPDREEMLPLDLNQAIRTTLVVSRNEYKYVADVVTDLGDIPAVTCHGGDISQAILNIIVNAAHAVEDVVRGTQGKGCITVQTRCDGESVTIRIGDSGAGIPEDIRPRVFDPFFTTKPIGKGTGQGLAIARAAVLKHGGDITFQSDVPGGTLFAIRLPLNAPPGRTDA